MEHQELAIVAIGWAGSLSSLKKAVGLLVVITIIGTSWKCEVERCRLDPS